MIASLTADGRLLFGTRIVRLFAYGLLSVILGLYLIEVGLSEGETGTVLSLTLLGDAVISLWLTTHADRYGRRVMLMVGAGLMLLAGVVFALTANFFLLTLAAIIGTISPSGNEIGPFLSIEQASLSQITPDKQRTHIFAWYALVGSLATACGALVGGGLTQLLQTISVATLSSYRVSLLMYAGLAILLMGMFSRLSKKVEVEIPPATSHIFGLHTSRGVVIKLSALFALDAFGGGLIVQSLVVYWFRVRFGADTAVIGAIFFGANILAGLSYLAAARLAARFGLINTMVFTHIPSNLLLILVPLMPTLPLAVGVLLVRFAISQMDVPTRQSYVMAVVDPAERSAAAGVTTIARSVGSAFSPLLTGILLGASLLNLPFLLAGGLKIGYDLLLYRDFRAIKPAEEQR
jgi:MFS family permease